MSEPKDNHHNALTCPYCNPKGLTFAEPPALARPAWQPMSTAPKDGSYIIAISTWNQYAKGVMQWVDGNWLDWNDEIIPTDALTHWQALPPLPEEADAQK